MTSLQVVPQDFKIGVTLTLTFQGHSTINKFKCDGEIVPTYDCLLVCHSNIIA